METDGAGYATCKVARNSVIAINPDPSRLATFQVAHIVLLPFTGLKALCFVLVGLQPTGNDTLQKSRRANDARINVICKVGWKKLDTSKSHDDLGAANFNGIAESVKPSNSVG